MKLSLGDPRAKYEPALERSPRASASRYERTTAAARSSPFAGFGGGAAGVAVAAGLCVARAGDGVITTGDVVGGTAAGVGEPLVLSAATCLAVGSGLGLAGNVGVIEGSGVGLVSCVGANVGAMVGARAGVGDAAGAMATVVGNAAGALRDPPKKCASTPPSNRPARTTTRIKGKSGNPPLGSSSRRRRRGGSLIDVARAHREARSAECL